MRRTIADARRVLEEDLAPGLNDGRLHEAREHIQRAEAHACAVAGEHLDRHEAEVRNVRTAALRELTEVRDGYEALTAEGAEARVSAQEYARRLDELAERQKHAEHSLANATGVVERFATVEDDPIAHFDEMARRLPVLMWDFPW